MFTCRAEFFDRNGNYVGKKSFRFKNKTFKYGDETYVINQDTNSYKETSFLFLNRRTYYYTKGNPNCMEFSQDLTKEQANKINAEQLQIVLDTKALRDINEQYKNSIWDKLDLKTILIFAGVAVLAILILTGKINLLGVGK